MNEIKTHFVNNQKLPLVVEPSKSFRLEEFYEFLSHHREHFQNEILKYGGILFRGFPLNTAQDFAAGIEHLGLGKSIDYIGGDSPRNKITGAVYTSTEAPPSFKIPLHNELSFVKNYPKHIYFFCETAPQSDGETILGDAREICKAIDPKVKEQFQQKNLKYISAYYYKSQLMELLNKWQRSHKSWPEVFEAKTKEEVEKKCIENDFGFKWTRNHWIKISQNRPALLKHPQTQEEVWFNQVHLYDFNPKLLGFWQFIGAKIFYIRKHMRLHEVSFGNGDPIPRKDIYHIMDILDQKTVKFPWQKGDFLVLDNILAMHGRAPFKGKRRILTAMTS